MRKMQIICDGCKTVLDKEIITLKENSISSRINMFPVEIKDFCSKNCLINYIHSKILGETE